MADDQHYLSVGPWDGDYDGDVFEIDHPPSCPLDEISDDTDDWPVFGMGCHVGQLVDDCGIDTWFQHADDPAADEQHEHVGPGRHPIEAWSVRYHSYEGPDEYDAGLALTEVTS